MKSRTRCGALAEAIGVNQSYLSRIMDAKGSQPPSKAVATQIAIALDLPEDYFAEFRPAVVIDVARENPALLGHRSLSE
jgi:transcriptional regulator with XRE-family HTH domain